ncbi:replication protein A 70 kDa DNA-binding subunit B [Striga asiatica]|uniref:Replication protein A 70 kDa DNA-binding subunit B n=1 Tax=Striga asiatica TaxID=4170 RepID=A0A5A7PUD6_STRAF|nr:replication protein A 70 kDa DNA-binding subunit B [Striga asiatica]
MLTNSTFYYKFLLVTMSRIYLPIKEITENTNNWTALIQVVERPPVHQSKNDSMMHYRRYLFTYEEGTKVAAVVYNTVIDEFALQLLMPYKRYYISRAKVRTEIPLYQVGDYKYKWTLVKGTMLKNMKNPCPHNFCAQLKFICLQICTNMQTQRIPETKTCWISGKIKLASDNKSLWSATCNNYRKNYNMQPNTARKCRSCQADTYVEARFRIPMVIKDETGTLYAMIYGTDAERIIPFQHE